MVFISFPVFFPFHLLGFLSVKGMNFQNVIFFFTAPLLVDTVMVLLVVEAVFLLCGILFQPPQVAAFKPLFQDGSLTHREITQMAILRKTAEVCRDIASAQGRDFTLPVRKRVIL